MRQMKGEEVATMVNTMKLKGKIVENGFTLREVAKVLDIDDSTLYRKMKSNGTSFTIGEANKLTKVLRLTKDEAMEIFFNSSVA